MGKTKLLYAGKNVWTYVYDTQKTTFEKDAVNVNGTQECRLDLYIFLNDRHPKRISSIDFEYPRYGGYKRGGDFESTGLDLTWLDLKNQKRPVFIIKLQNPKGLMGMITQDVLVVFDDELKNAVSQAQFGSGDSNAAYYNSWGTSFFMGKDSLLEVIYGEGSKDGSRETTYKWVNNRFRPFSQRTHNLEPNSNYENVPLTQR